MSLVDPQGAGGLNQVQLDRLFEQMTLKAQGAAYIKAAGNGFSRIAAGNYVLNRTGGELRLPFENSNIDPSNSNFWNLVVSASNTDGVRSSYSSVGSNVFLTACGGSFALMMPLQHVLQSSTVLEAHALNAREFTTRAPKSPIRSCPWAANSSRSITRKKARAAAATPR